MAPVVEELPFIVTVPVAQVKIPVVEEPALGKLALVVTDVVEVLTQPLPGSVTVTV